MEEILRKFNQLDHHEKAILVHRIWNTWLVKKVKEGEPVET